MTYRIPLLDLTRYQRVIAAEVDRAWHETLAAMRLLNGAQVRRFEEEIAAYAGVPHACGVSSGTDALLLGLVALGVGPGDRVVVPANAFIAVLTVVHRIGAEPVLVDLAESGYGPDFDAVSRALPARALMVVHLYGHALELDRLLALCSESDTFLIEDCSHAHGATRGGRHVGTTGAIGCFSAGIVKNLSAYGDAGFVLTSNLTIDATLRELRAQGQRGKNQHVRYGFNARLDELQAAVLRIKLRDLDERNRRRRAIAAYYSERFALFDIQLPTIAGDEVPVFHQYVVRSAVRDRLQTHLAERGIETGIHYPVPLHRQEAWTRYYGDTLRFPRAERLAEEVLSLPVFPDLTDAEVDEIVAAVGDFFRACRARSSAVPNSSLESSTP
jgi:dTDP-4-amino-4,6-dideoxygalactose transaminase